MVTFPLRPFLLRRPHLAPNAVAVLSVQLLTFVSPFHHGVARITTSIAQARRRLLLQPFRGAVSSVGRKVRTISTAQRGDDVQEGSTIGCWRGGRTAAGPAKGIKSRIQLVGGYGHGRSLDDAANERHPPDAALRSASRSEGVECVQAEEEFPVRSIAFLQIEILF